MRRERACVRGRKSETQTSGRALAPAPCAQARPAPLTPRLANARRSARARPLGLVRLAVPVAPRVPFGWRVTATFRALGVVPNPSAGYYDPALPAVGVRFSARPSGRCVRCCA